VPKTDAFGVNWDKTNNFLDNPYLQNTQN